MKHELKTWPKAFKASNGGVKCFEIRNDDRKFAVGDELVLREWGCESCLFPDGYRCDRCSAAGYTGRSFMVSVTYKVPGGEWGLPSGLCVLGTKYIRGSCSWQ